MNTNRFTFTNKDGLKPRTLYTVYVQAFNEIEKGPKGQSSVISAYCKYLKTKRTTRFTQISFIAASVEVYSKSLVRWYLGDIKKQSKSHDKWEARQNKLEAPVAGNYPVANWCRARETFWPPGAGKNRKWPPVSSSKKCAWLPSWLEILLTVNRKRLRDSFQIYRAYLSCKFFVRKGFAFQKIPFPSSIGPPSGPYTITNNVTWLNSTSFTLKWTRPPNDGGDPDLRYIVEYSKETADGKYVHWNSRKNILTQEYNVTGLESGSKYEFRIFVSNVAGRKREPAVKEFNVYSGLDVTPTPTDPGKISSFSQGRI